MNICRSRVLFTAIIMLMSIVLMAPVTAQADPLGQLVNLIMNKILDARDQEAEQQKNTLLATPNRSIPKESKLGTLAPPNGNQIKIDGDAYQLAFNSRIRDEGNRIVPGGMIQQEKRVRYTLNAQQQVDKIWLLTPGEE